MRKLSHNEISEKRLSIEQLRTTERFPIYALIDNVRSMYNVGSIFRTSDGARIEKLFLTGFTPHPPRIEIEKTALGATQTVPWEYHKDPLRAIQTARELGAKICVLEQTDRSTPHYAVGKEHFPLCLVVGNEINGISNEIIAQADFAMEIPMFGMKQSLNVGVAYGIGLYELVRVWKQTR